MRPESRRSMTEQTVETATVDTSTDPTERPKAGPARRRQLLAEMAWGMRITGSWR